MNRIRIRCQQSVIEADDQNMLLHEPFRRGKALYLRVAVFVRSVLDAANAAIAVSGEEPDHLSKRLVRRGMVRSGATVADLPTT